MSFLVLSKSHFVVIFLIDCSHDFGIYIFFKSRRIFFFSKLFSWSSIQHPLSYGILIFRQTNIFLLTHYGVARSLLIKKSQKKRIFSWFYDLFMESNVSKLSLNFFRIFEPYERVEKEQEVERDSFRRNVHKRKVDWEGFPSSVTLPCHVDLLTCFLSKLREKCTSQLPVPPNYWDQRQPVQWKRRPHRIRMEDLIAVN